MTDLTPLRSRIESLTGPDREVEAIRRLWWATEHKPLIDARLAALEQREKG